MDNSSSCIVPSYIKCNSATEVHDGATCNATVMQPPSLLKLAARVLDRNTCNRVRNQTATRQLRQDESSATQKSSNAELHRGATDISLAGIGQNPESCTVAFTIEHNHATHFTYCQCGYNKPFCSCNIISPGMVTCNTCEHFTPDIIGDGSGIGNCGLEVKWTQEFTGRMPLFRYSERHCQQFSKLMD